LGAKIFIESKLQICFLMTKSGFEPHYLFWFNCSIFTTISKFNFASLEGARKKLKIKKIRNE